VRTPIVVVELDLVQGRTWQRDGAGPARAKNCLEKFRAVSRAASCPGQRTIVADHAIDLLRKAKRRSLVAEYKSYDALAS
jgi:hypothetical protein